MMQSRLAQIMAALGAFGVSPYGNIGESTRVPYPYVMGHRHDRAGRGPQHRKKGPGRRHHQGKANHARRFERKLRTCKP